MYVARRRIRETTFALIKKKELPSSVREWARLWVHQCTGVCLRACSDIYPAYNAHARYRHCGLSGSTASLTLSRKGTIFVKKHLNIKRVFWVSLPLFETFLILRRIQLDVKKNWKRRHCCYCQILNKFEFSRHVFEKSSNFKFHQHPSSGSLVVPYG